jgi:hypothetical protein
VMCSNPYRLGGEVDFFCQQNGSPDQPFLSSRWPTKCPPQIFPSIINNRVSLNFLILGLYFHHFGHIAIILSNL